MIGTKISVGGTIVESGSNANGSYIKWSDGTMICMKEVSENVTWSTWGNYWQESSSINLGDFPVAFKSGTVPFEIVQNKNAAAAMASGGASSVSNTSAGSMRVYRPNNPGTVTATIDVIAIGRWF